LSAADAGVCYLRRFYLSAFSSSESKLLNPASSNVRGDDIPLNRIEHGIRSYDPCLSCSTHAVGQMPLHIQLIAPDGPCDKRAAGSTTLAWTGDNGGPFAVAGLGSPSGGFGVQRASVVTGPYTTVAFAPNNSTTLADAASTSFYRIVGPVCGMTTLCAPPVTLP
jgi:hypothetical protein